MKKNKQVVIFALVILFVFNGVWLMSGCEPNPSFFDPNIVSDSIHDGAFIRYDDNILNNMDPNAFTIYGDRAVFQVAGGFTFFRTGNYYSAYRGVNESIRLSLTNGILSVRFDNGLPRNTGGGSRGFRVRDFQFKFDETILFIDEYPIQLPAPVNFSFTSSTNSLNGSLRWSSASSPYAISSYFVSGSRIGVKYAGANSFTEFEFSSAIVRMSNLALTQGINILRISFLGGAFLIYDRISNQEGLRVALESNLTYISIVKDIDGNLNIIQ